MQQSNLYDYLQVVLRTSKNLTLLFVQNRLGKISLEIARLIRKACSKHKVAAGFELQHKRRKRSNNKL